MARNHQVLKLFTIVCLEHVLNKMVRQSHTRELLFTNLSNAWLVVLILESVALAYQILIALALFFPVTGIRDLSSAFEKTR